MSKINDVVYLAGVKKTEDAQSIAPTNLHVISGEVVEDSLDGQVSIQIEGDIFSEDDDASFTVDTLGGLTAGDTATIILSGESGRAMTPLAIGSVGSIDRISLRVNDIEADYVKASTLDADVANIGFLKSDSAVITNLQAADVTINGRIDATEADIDDLEAEDARIGNLVAQKASITDLNAATARIGSLEAADVTINGRIDATEADIDDLEAEDARIGNLVAQKASITDLNAATARIGDLEADHVSVEDFEAEQANIDTLQANTADIATIRANSAKVQNLTAAQLEADHATVGSLSATYATITNLDAATGRISDLESTRVRTTDLEANYITADTIEANYTKTDLSNTDVAWIQNGTIKDGAISNAMIGSLSASKLTAGTINGNTITVTNLNADNITAGTLNGQRIGEGSLSLSKLEEDVYTESEVDSIVSNLQTQIDGAIETWTGTAVPTLNNSPASGWTTNAVKDSHVGDVYFVVNSNSQQNGYNYRFTKSGSTYSWQLIKDSDVTNALQRLSTAEGKITTFDSDISQLKTDTGTLTTKTTSLETRMSDAESDILDKVDTTTFNEVSDTVDSHSQSITQMSTTLSNKADSSTVTAVTNRVSKTEQDISGINTTIGTMQTTLASKADGSTVETMSTKLNTVSDTVDGHTQSISSITSTQTTMQGKLDKTLVETTQLWFSKANTTAPNKPTAQVISTSTAGNAWRVVVPAYNASYPNYYYCYQWKYSDGTYGWSSVTRDIAMGESQERARTAITNAAAADTKAGNAASAAATAQSTADTANSNASAAVSTANTANSNASTALSTANTAASDASDAKTDAATALSTANTASSNASTALSTANTASSNASTAVNTANTAKSTADTAKATADKNVKSTTQLWYTKANETAPAKPTVKVTSTAVSGNGWRVVVPTYASDYPYYFYCYQYELADGTFTWSDVVYDRATTENQANSRSAVTGVSTLTTKTNDIQDTVDGHTQSLQSVTSTQTSIQQNAVKSTVQLWFTKANTTAPNKPTVHVTTNNAATGNAWNLAVPTYNASYPNYYYCYEYQYLDGSYGWSAVTRDIATGEMQERARTAITNAAAADTKAGNAATAAANAQATANKNVKESQQLWFTKANGSAPNKPTAAVTSTSTSGNAWTTKVPTYSASYPHYFYCMQYKLADGTYTWSDVVYDQATTEAQSVARTTSTNLSTLQQDYATFKQTTQNFESTIGTTYATKTEVSAVDDKIDNLEIGGRNLVRWSTSPEYKGGNVGKSSDSTGWYAWSTSTTGVVDTDEGIKCVFTGNSTGLVIPLVYDNAVLGDEVLTISFDYRGTLETVTSLYLLTRSGGNVTQSGSTPPGLIVSETNWQHYEYTFKFSSLGNRGATHSILLPYTTSNGKWFEIKDRSFKLEKGDKATGWTPAPEDVEADISSIETRLSTAETSITQNNQQIALKANTSDVYTKTQTDGLISTEVSNRNSAIEQSASAINLSVSETYTTKTEFNNRDFDFDNLIPNARTMALGISNYSIGRWHTAGNADMSKSRIEIEDGPFGSCGAFQLVGTQTVTSDASCFGMDSFPVVSGERYRMSLYARVLEGSGYAGISQVLTGSSQNRKYVDSNTTYSWASYQCIPLTASWKQVWVEFEALGSASNLYIGGVGTDAKIQMCMVSLKVSQTSHTELESAKSEIKTTTDSITSTVEKISSAKYLMSAVSAGAPLSSIRGFASTTTKFQVTDTKDSRVGDTIYLKYKDSTRKCYVYIKGVVTVVNSTTSITLDTQGYEDVLPVDTIKSTINQSSDSVKIQARHVEIDGAAIFSNSDFKAAADAAYDAKGSASAVQTNLDNLEIGGRNLLRYRVYNYADASNVIAVNSSYRGMYCAVDGGETYTISRKTIEGNRFWIEWSEQEPASGVSLHLLSNNNTAMKVTVNVPSEANWLFIYLSNQGDEIHDGNIKIERGTKATDWTPAPEDVNADISLAIEQAKAPIDSKTYTGIIGTANSFAGANFFFGKLYPDNYNKGWQAKLRIECEAPDTYQQSLDITFGGYGSTFSSYDSVTSLSSARAFYYFELFRATSTGINANVGHMLGVSLQSATNPTNSSYARTIRVDILEVTNCTIELNNTAVAYTSMAGYSVENYGGGTTNLTQMNVATAGQNATNNTNTNDTARYVQFYNTIVAGEALVKESLIGGHEDGKFYQISGANDYFMLSQPLLWITVALNANATNCANIYTQCYDRNLATYYTSFTNTLANKIVYLVGTINGDKFTIYGSASNQYLTITEPTTADGRFYIPLGRLGNQSNGKNYFNFQVSYPVSLYAYLDGKFRQVTPTEIVGEQYIYCSAVSGTNSMVKYETWVEPPTSVTSSTQNSWTTKRPEYSSSYPVLFVAKQTKRLDGTVTCTTPVKDDTTTIIDGGHITTGTIDADRISTTVVNAINANVSDTINADKINVSAISIGSLNGASDYATKSDAQGYANAKDAAIAAAAKRTDVSIAVTAINYDLGTATLQATLYIDGTATTSNVTYKWLKDGSVISGQTARTLSITAAMGLSHVYSCTVTYS